MPSLQSDSSIGDGSRDGMKKVKLAESFNNQGAAQGACSNICTTEWNER